MGYTPKKTVSNDDENDQDNSMRTNSPANGTAEFECNIYHS